MSARLIGVELTRLRWRRAVLALVAITVLVPTALIGFRIYETRPMTADDRAEILRTFSGEVTNCLQRPKQYALPRGSERAACERVIVDWYGQRPTLALTEERGGSEFAVTALLIVCLVLVGTTFAGHDWNTGSMSNQLLFEPRRLRVWASKATAVALLSGLVSLAVSLGTWTLLWRVAVARDLPLGPGGVSTVMHFGLWSAGFATAAAVGAFALTMLVRSTVVTLGVLFGVSVVGGLMIGVLGISDRWAPPTNLDAILTGEATYYVEVPQSCFGPSSYADVPPPECIGEERLSRSGGIGYYGGALAVVTALSVVSFRRRDVP